jgi:nucleotide-binding universal stress UspA family protein
MSLRSRTSNRHHGITPEEWSALAIVCGIDLSLTAGRAVRVAAALAARLGEPLILAHVLDSAWIAMPGGARGG